MKKVENELERDINAWADRMLADIEALPAQAAPIGAVKLSRQEQLEQYEGMRLDPQAWARIFTEQGAEEAFKYGRTMEARREAENAKREPAAEAVGPTLTE